MANFTDVGYSPALSASHTVTTEAETKFNSGSKVKCGHLWKAVLVTSVVIAAVAAVAVGIFIAFAMPIAAGLTAGVALIGLAGITVCLISPRSAKRHVYFREMTDEEAHRAYTWQAKHNDNKAIVEYKYENKFKVLYSDKNSRQVLMQSNTQIEAANFSNIQYAKLFG